MSALPAPALKRAIGIVRVSEVKGRSGESFHSPDVQRERIEEECERHDFTLVDVIDELDVSGGKPLSARPFGKAIERVERGEVDAIVFAYRDRTDRSIVNGSEAIERIEAAGGLLIAGSSVLSHATADKWAEATMGSFMAEWQRRLIRQKSGEAQERVVARGVVPWPNIAPGYRKRTDGVLEPDELAPIVRQAFELRAKGKNGTPIQEVQAFLAANGIKRSFHGVQHLLASRIYLGEINFGKLVNLTAHEPIIDRKLFDRVQRLKMPRGRQAKSERLLARLGVLRCASCNARMVVGSSNRRKNDKAKYFIYRCPPVSDCTARVTISATIVEDAVVEAVKAALKDDPGRADAQRHVRDAQAALDAAQEALDGALAAFAAAGVGTEPAAVQRLSALRAARDTAQERVDQIGTPEIALQISAATDWDRLTLDEQRALIRATIERVTVGPGRGDDRINVELFSE